MVILLLEFSVPVILGLGFVLARLWLDIRRPVPRALGSILPKLCVVSSDEILRYNETEDEEKAAPHLQREVRWKQICVNWGYLRQMMWNTRLFQQATRFERMKIDPTKSALDYEAREQLALELVDESADMRRELYKWQIRLLMRAMLAQRIDQRVLITLLGQYKQLETEMVTFAGMAEDDCYRQMLIERLGLSGWGLIEGGSSTPA